MWLPPSQAGGYRDDDSIYRQVGSRGIFLVSRAAGLGLPAFCVCDPCAGLEEEEGVCSVGNDIVTWQFSCGQMLRLTASSCYNPAEKDAKTPQTGCSSLASKQFCPGFGFQSLIDEQFARARGPNFVLSCGAAAVSPPAADVISVYIGPYRWDQVGMHEMRGNVM